MCPPFRTRCRRSTSKSQRNQRNQRANRRVPGALALSRLAEPAHAGAASQVVPPIPCRPPFGRASPGPAVGVLNPTSRAVSNGTGGGAGYAVDVVPQGSGSSVYVHQSPHVLGERPVDPHVSRRVFFYSSGRQCWSFFSFFVDSRVRETCNGRFAGDQTMRRFGAGTEVGRRPGNLVVHLTANLLVSPRGWDREFKSLRVGELSCLCNSSVR